ncbi:MAG: hypothetical protein IPK82_29690 [Polyangiaceae bacterium]|nr:hypothetical protein [Polyangiaceae bacterium]
MLNLKSSLGRLAPPVAFLTAVLSLTGCQQPNYRHDVSVRVAAEADVSVDLVDVQVPVEATVTVLCTDSEFMGDAYSCGVEYPAVTGVWIGPRGAEQAMSSDGFLPNYQGGLLNVIVETADRTYEREYHFPSVFGVSFEPETVVPTEPFTLTWDPHFEAGIHVTVGVGSQTEWANAQIDDQDDGEEVVDLEGMGLLPGVYQLEIDRGNVCSRCDPEWADEGDLVWQVFANVLRTKEITVPPQTP